MMLRPVGSPIRAVDVADDEYRGVPEILKMLHLAKQDGVAEVQVGRSGIEAGLDAQRTAGLLDWIRRSRRSSSRMSRRDLS